MVDYRLTSINNNEKRGIYDGVILLIRGGGVKSASSIGIIKALEELNIPIVAVSGTSIGAIPAALLACGFSADEILEKFLLYNKALNNSSELKGGKGSIEIERFMQELIGNKKFSSTKVPCFINASDGNFLKAYPFLFSEEETPEVSLAKACRASASFPFFYRGFNTNINGYDFHFVDGGVTENTFVPKTKNFLTIYSTFISNRERKILNRGLLFGFEKPPYVTEEKADIVIKPDLGEVGTTGGIDIIYNAYLDGYNEATRVLSHYIKNNCDVEKGFQYKKII